MTKLEQRIAQARGDEPADLVLRGGKVFDLITGTMIEGDVAICGDRIVGIAADYEGRHIIDVSGLTLVPGFIDTHLHVESSLVTPFEFDRCVTPAGSPPRSVIRMRSQMSSGSTASAISSRRRNIC